MFELYCWLVIHVVRLSSCRALIGIGIDGISGEIKYGRAG